MRTSATPSYCEDAALHSATEPVFQVRVMKHVGLLIAWYNRSYTVTGSYAQCQQELARAQRHNKAVGWWSLASLLMWNWVALAGNASARKTLQRQAAFAFGHPSTFIGPANLRLVTDAPAARGCRGTRPTDPVS